MSTTAVGGIAWFVLHDSPDGPDPVGTTELIEPPDPQVAAKTDDSAEPSEPVAAPAPKPATAPAPKPTTSTGSSTGSSTSTRKTGSGSSGSSKPASTTPAEPNPDEMATGGEYTVRFVAQGQEAVLECFDGRDKVEFVNATRQTFEGVVTCRVHIDGSMGVVQVRQESTVACVASGSQVSCAAQ